MASSAKEVLDSLAHTPSVTYRVQLSPRFGFTDARRIVAYLRRLGVSHFYSSPLLRARSGSLHCYDVVRHDELNPEIGPRAEFEAFSRELARNGMHLLLDIVPNHMHAGDENPLWVSVLELGPFSEHAESFDIRWEPEGRVVLPILPEELGALVGTDALELQYDPEGAGFVLVVGKGQRLPLSPRSYASLLELALRTGLSKVEEKGLRALASEFSKFPEPQTGRASKRALSDYSGLKERLRAAAGTEGRLLERLRAAAREASRSRDSMMGVLDEQFYRLTYWRNASTEVNYRRFLNLNDYVSIREEDPRVFREAHSLVEELVAQGHVAGLRVDHPDGLYDPGSYLQRLSSSTARVARGATVEAPYVVVEKILKTGERLPSDWSIDGSTGYDFLNLVNGLFVYQPSREKFDGIYVDFAGPGHTFDEEGRTAQRDVIEKTMLSDVWSLAGVLESAGVGRHRRYTGVTLESLARAVAEVAACLMIYRTYCSPRRTLLTPSEAGDVFAAISKARVTPGIDSSALDLVEDALLGRGLAESPERLRFVMGFQQFTPAVIVKGNEDTAFYRCNRLVSLNEVGGNPDEFGISIRRFHNENTHRASRWPRTMLATATHDTKRGEDVRTRIDVLTEIPEEWGSAVKRWSSINAKSRAALSDGPAPSRNDEYLLYQTLVGAWPIRPSDLSEFTERMVAYMHKASKEAKQRTSWTDPNKEYDDALERFVRAVLKPDGQFVRDFRGFEARVAPLGRLNSLSQLLLKLTSPGIPDIYQGTELWDLSLVDPDNRRDVDFARREKALKALDRRSKVGKAGLASALVRRPEDGLVKLFVLSQTLAYRNEHRAVFAGRYAGVRTSGPRRAHVCAFVRSSGHETALVVASRFFALMGAEEWPLADPGKVWNGTTLNLGKGMPGRWVDVLTGKKLQTSHHYGGGTTLSLSSVLSDLPVALLHGEMSDS